jgi:hypothetical protein
MVKPLNRHEFNKQLCEYFDEHNIKYAILRGYGEDAHAGSDLDLSCVDTRGVKQAIEKICESHHSHVWHTRHSTNAHHFYIAAEPGRDGVFHQIDCHTAETVFGLVALRAERIVEKSICKGDVCFAHPVHQAVAAWLLPWLSSGSDKRKYRPMVRAAANDHEDFFARILRELFGPKGNTLLSPIIDESQPELGQISKRWLRIFLRHQLRTHPLQSIRDSRGFLRLWTDSWIRPSGHQVGIMLHDEAAEQALAQEVLEIICGTGRAAIAKPDWSSTRRRERLRSKPLLARIGVHTGVDIKITNDGSGPRALSAELPPLELAKHLCRRLAGAAK